MRDLVPCCISNGPFSILCSMLSLFEGPYHHVYWGCTARWLLGTSTFHLCIHIATACISLMSAFCIMYLVHVTIGGDQENILHDLSAIKKAKAFARLQLAWVYSNMRSWGCHKQIFPHFRFTRGGALWWVKGVVLWPCTGPEQHQQRGADKEWW